MVFSSSAADSHHREGILRSAWRVVYSSLAPSEYRVKKIPEVSMSALEDLRTGK